MALTERTKTTRLKSLVNKAVQVRRADIVERDGVEIARTFHRHVLQPGTLGESNALIDTDISGEDADVQAICNAAWTDAVKEAWRLKLVADAAASE